jgi:hypothetical protein
MTTALKSLKELMLAGLCLIGLGLLAWNFPTLLTVSRALLQKATSVTTIEVEGVKIAFDQGNVSSRLTPFDVNAAEKAKVLEAVNGLESDEFERLMNVGELKALCDYQRPTVEMRRMLMLDYQLQAKGLTAIVDDPELKARIKGQAKIDEETSGKASDIGYPHNCYVMNLTDTGRNVKTALVKILSGAFNQHVALK